MAIGWNLKKYLAVKHSIYKVTELKKLIAEKTGVIISLQNLCNHVNLTPEMIRIETMQIICSALECNLNDFFTITSSVSKNRSKKKRKLSYKNAPKTKIGVKKFPNPQNYE